MIDLRFALLPVLYCLLLAFPAHLQANDDRPAPNVLFVCVDDMNDWVGCLEGCPGQVHTPHIDTLAARGMLFTNAHCAAPVCNPSRTAILTGRQPTSTGIYDNGRWWKPVLPDVVTLPMCFREAGYRVAGGGKVFHHTPGFNPPDQWDSYFLQVFDAPWHRPGPNDALPVKGLHWPEGFPLNGLHNVRTGKRPPANPKEFDWGPFQKPDREMGDGQMVEWAKQFLRQEHERPFFLAAGIFRPHLPWYVPEKYFEMYPLDEIVLPEVPADDLDDIPSAGRKMAAYRGDEFLYVKNNGRWKEAVQAYLASISFADALVGELLHTLDRSPHAENTIVVLWSDHGWHLGEKHHWHKFTLWDEATRVPLIITAPGITTPGSETAQPVGLIDLYPTLTELCGVTPPDRLDGVSLVPLLKHPAAKSQRPALTTHGRGNHGVRSEHWRYIRFADGSEELYDHRVDPHEWKNLADVPEHAAVKQGLAGRIPSQESPEAPRKSQFRFDPRTYTWERK
jgi:arylsulfatase A-like enzyme